jgi:hypothetical protein
MYVCIYVYCMYIRVCIYIYICTHTHTHTHTKVEAGVAKVGAAEHARMFPLHVKIIKEYQPPPGGSGAQPFSENSNPWLDIAFAVLGSPIVKVHKKKKKHNL